MPSGLRKALSGVVRSPLLHFVVIGALGGLIYGWIWGRGEGDPDRTIRITAADIGRAEAEWTARWNRPPTAEELDGLIRGRIREAALYREAVAMGLAEDDAVVRRVLVRKLETIARDLVELSLSPTQQDLATFFEDHADRYRPDPRITFTQVFVDPDEREERTLPDAETILAELQALGPPGEDIEEYGDPLMVQRHFVENTEQDVARLFGGAFARSIFELEPGRWHGPVLSGYGTHLVWVEEIRELPPPTLAEVEDRVRQDWIDDSRRRITEQYFEQLLDRYEIIVEREPADGTAETPIAQTPAP